MRMRRPDWSAAERDAWRWPAKLTPSTWAEKYRRLSRAQSSRFGQWRNATAPYLAGIMDLPFRCPRVRRCYVLKAAQVGVSEALRNVLGYMASEEPDPCLLVLPDEKSGKTIFSDRIWPLLEDTEVLSSLTTARSRDISLYEVSLKNGWNLRLAWSGSATSLASHPIRVVIADELDKMATWVGTESDPLSLADVRTATYPNSIVYAMSTPTTREGRIWRVVEDCQIRLYYFVPCPHCGARQRLTFDRIKWDKGLKHTDAHKYAAAVDAKRAAWYECVNGCRIVDKGMMNAGCWQTEDGSFQFYADGRIVGQLPDGSDVGFIGPTSLHSLAAKHSWHSIAAEFIRCGGDGLRIQNFRNSWLGEPFEVQVTRTASNEISARRESAPPPLIVPDWACTLLATSDVQRDHFHWLIRAWGYGLRSQLIHYGMCRTFDELYAAIFGSTFHSVALGPVACTALLIDSGDGLRTNEIYEFAQKDQRICPIKGASWPMRRPWTMTTLQNGVCLRTLDTDFYKDMLARLIASPDGLWQVHNAIDEDYALQMASEQKVFDRRKNKNVWVLKHGGAANHVWDMEVYQCAGADMANVAVTQATTPKSDPPPAPEPEEETAEDRRAARAGTWSNWKKY